MSNDLAMKAENVGKKYCKNLARSMMYGAMDIISGSTGKMMDSSLLRKDEFWAVDGVSFELKRGEVLGIIGRNGAGKTTLLKLLNGIFMPDRGAIKIWGKIGALIQLGAGFHPMLTGKENIYVNGAILGMSKKEVDSKFDSIVDFADIGDFLDTPVKNYSSGMYVRLGFAIAAHSEPEILLIDEVLAVGDVSFRRKCFKKLGEMKEKGITWILISHDMGTIKNSCDKVMFLDRGRVSYMGTADQAISEYYCTVSGDGTMKRSDLAAGSAADKRTGITGVNLTGAANGDNKSFATGETINAQISFVSEKRIDNPVFGIQVMGMDGIFYFGTNTKISGFHIDHVEGKGTVSIKLFDNGLKPGLYRLRVDMHDRHMGTVDLVNDAAYFSVKGGAFVGDAMFYNRHEWGLA
ncbi:MAG: ABC transporter ATP-binding protein [Candidatus Omnitrophica bacterium]|nr:ABC transporter ATP-binding protein [Candidatus Omnitrophota bacterium]